MKLTVFTFCIVCFVGCLPVKQISNSSAPQLLIQSQFPPIPVTMQQPVIKLDIMMFILKDGTVGRARMLKGSGDAAWDSLAMSSIKQWRFVPARLDDKPIDSWFHMQSVMRYAEPNYMNLAEILCVSEEQADSVYKMIEEGQNFNELAVRYSADSLREKGGIIGSVNINLYPENVRVSLGKLETNECTKPIKYADLYAIFKRLK